MMASEAQLFAQFGNGDISVGGFKVYEPEYWCISIRELAEAELVGTSLTKDVKFIGKNEILLSFPTENQMIAVMAAFTNQSFEVVHNKWKASQAEKAIREAQ